MPWTTRPARSDDTAAVLRLVDRLRTDGGLPVDPADLLPGLLSPSSSVVTTVGDEVVAGLVAVVDGEVGRILAIVISPEWRRRGIGSSLLELAEVNFAKAGVRRITALLGEGQIGEQALLNRGFEATTGLCLYEKDEPLRPTAMSILERWNGELVGPSAWERFAGLRAQRELVEERVLAPLLQPDLAAQYGVVAPTSMMLFGPPGTGKTSFAKAVAGRLGWPFVELLPSKLGANGTATMADELHRAFLELLQLDHVVIFIDEIDDIASSRARRPESQAVVNELLKAILRVRESPGRLLIGATNAIADLDTAVIRPGRIDLMLPIGPPDDEARRAILSGLLQSIERCDAGVDELLGASAGMTPADMGAAVQRAAAEAFRSARSGDPDAALTAEALRAAFAATGRTIGDDDLRAFEAQAVEYQRT